MTRRLLLLVFGVVFVVQAVVLVVGFYPAPHNGGDNAGYLTLAHSLLEHGAYLELWDPVEPAHTKYPPVFPLILAGAMLFGASSWIAFKALSLAFASAAVLLTFAWVAGRRGLGLAVGVALLFAFSDALRWSSQWILSDPPFLAFTFLALWSFDRAHVRGIPALEGDRMRWLWIGCAAAILAYFTRSAGLPLVVAAALWMASRRRWRPLAFFLAAFGVPAFLWWLRTRMVGDPTYMSEFWMINPYDPSAGRAGAAELVSRVVANFHLYVGTYFPLGLTGIDFRFLTAAGYFFFLIAAAGWLHRTLEGVTVAELFAPLYLGLILLWPEVWSGDRFALPLYPLLLFYSGSFVLDGIRAWTRGAGAAEPAGQTGRSSSASRGTSRGNEGEEWRDAPPSRAGFVIGAALFLLLAAPALLAWSHSVQRASACRAVQALSGGDPFTCYPGPTGEFVAAARWTGEHLPDGAVVLARKPRLFFVLSGVKSRMYPLSREPEVFREAARDAGAGYLLMDHVDDVGPYYLSSILLERPDFFCSMIAWGRAEEETTKLLGIVPEEGVAVRQAGEPREARAGVGAGQGAAESVRQNAPVPDEMVEIVIPGCDRSVVRDVPLRPSLPLARVPLLDRHLRAAQSSPSP